MITSTSTLTTKWDSATPKTLNVQVTIDGVPQKYGNSVQYITYVEGGITYNGILIVVTDATTSSAFNVTLPNGTTGTKYTFVEFQLGNPPTRRPNPRFVVKDIIPN